ncbi:MAG: GNAT family N-acetyltransferase, partial [Candidatus Berkiella sp.]
MQVNYAKDSALFNRVVKLINEVFPGAKQMIAYGDALGAHWSEASIPFVVEKQGNIIAHLGIVPITLSLPNKTLNVAALHGICVKKTYRRQGYFRLLMTEALAYIQENFDSSILFTHDPHFYQDFGYEFLPQNDFAVAVNHEGSDNTDLRRLYLEQPEDLALFKRLYAHKKANSAPF